MAVLLFLISYSYSTKPAEITDTLPAIFFAFFQPMYMPPFTSRTWPVM
jgi:hypothetical protein